MTTTTVAGVVTAVNSGKRVAGHLEQFTGMDFEDKYTTTNRQDHCSVHLALGLLAGHVVVQWWSFHR
eukprot:6241802-Amphidinium_carterae.1